MIVTLTQDQIDDVWVLIGHGLRTIDRTLSLHLGTARRVLAGAPLDELDAIARHHASGIWALLPRLMHAIDTALRLPAGTVRDILKTGQHTSWDSMVAAQARYREHMDDCARRRAVSQRHRFPNGRA